MHRRMTSRRSSRSRRSARRCRLITPDNVTSKSSSGPVAARSEPSNGSYSVSGRPAGLAATVVSPSCRSITCCSSGGVANSAPERGIVAAPDTHLAEPAASYRYDGRSGGDMTLAVIDSSRYRSCPRPGAPSPTVTSVGQRRVYHSPRPIARAVPQRRPGERARNLPTCGGSSAVPASSLLRPSIRVRCSAEARAGRCASATGGSWPTKSTAPGGADAGRRRAVRLRRTYRGRDVLWGWMRPACGTSATRDEDLAAS